MLLTQQENGAGGKADTTPDVWFANKPKEYLEMHLIPNDPALWKLDRFEDFIVARKALMREKFKHLLVPAAVPLANSKQAAPQASAATV
jgi:hypothetical protein